MFSDEMTKDTYCMDCGKESLTLERCAYRRRIMVVYRYSVYQQLKKKIMLAKKFVEIYYDDCHITREH